MRSTSHVMILVRCVQVAVKNSIGTRLFSLGLVNNFCFRRLNSFFLKLLPKLLNKCHSSTTPNRMSDLRSSTRCGYFSGDALGGWENDNTGCIISILDQGKDGIQLVQQVLNFVQVDGHNGSIICTCLPH